MELFFSLILLVLIIFLIFFIKSSNKDFYDKYLFFIDRKENVFNIFILIILSFFCYQSHHSKEFDCYFDNIFIENIAKNIEIKFLLFVVFVVLAIKYLDTDFFEMYYSFKFYNIFFLMNLLFPILYNIRSYNDENYDIFFVFSSFILAWIGICIFKFKRKKLLKMLFFPFSFFILGLGTIFYSEKNISDEHYYSEVLENYSKEKMPSSRIFKISKLEFGEVKFIKMICNHYSTRKKEEVLKKYELDIETQLEKLNNREKMVMDIFFSFLYGNYYDYIGLHEKILIALVNFNKLKTIEEKNIFLSSLLSEKNEEYFEKYYNKIIGEQHDKYIEILSREYSDGMFGYVEFLETLRREIK